MDLQPQDRSELVTSPDVAGLGLQAGFNHDVSARVLFALSSGDDFVVLDGENTVAREQLPTVIARLHEAGFGTAVIAAPLSRLAVLDDAIRGAMAADAAAARPLVVIIEHAEKLSIQTLQRLAALAELRQSGRPVLRFLLSGTSVIWSALRDAGLGELEDDAAAHVGLMPAPAPRQPPLRKSGSPLRQPGASGSGASALRSPSRAANRHPSRPERLQDAEEAGIGIGSILVAVALMLAGISLASWVVLKPGPPAGPRAAQQAAPLSADDRLAILLDRENRQIAANHLWSPPGDNLIETRHEIDKLLPQLSTPALHRLTEAAARADAITNKRAAEVTEPTRRLDEALPPAPDGP